MRVALTGSTGFVGRRLLDRLRDDGCSVVPLTRRGEGDAARWELGADDNDPAALAGVDVLIHAAARIPADQQDATEAARCFDVNALGSLALLEAAAAAGVAHAVVLSSGNLYRDRDAAALESAALFPSPHAPFYLVSKLAEEAFAGFVRERRGLSTVILRPSAVYGPGMAEQGVVARFAARLSAGEPVRIQDGGRHGVDLVYVDDVVEATAAAARRRASDTFNVGSGERTSVLDLARAFCRILGADERALLDIEPAEGDGPAGFAPLDVRAARERLGYRPTSLDDGLRSYLAWRT